MEVVQKIVENPDLLANAVPGKPKNTTQLQPQHHMMHGNNGDDDDDDDGGCC